MTGDAVTGTGLADALDGIDVAYFLIHSMEQAQNGEHRLRGPRAAAAENFARRPETPG